jgi:hypothetical protein
MSTETDARSLTVELAVCSVCELLFAKHVDRPYSPCHGADPVAVLATITLRPDGQVLGTWGGGIAVEEASAAEETVDEAPPVLEAAAVEAPPVAAPTQAPPSEEEEATTEEGAAEAASGGESPQEIYLHDMVARCVAGDLEDEALRRLLIQSRPDPDWVFQVIEAVRGLRDLLQEIRP